MTTTSTGDQSPDVLFGRVLVTGANGLLGQALIRRLSADPRYDVLATGRDNRLLAVDASCGYTPLDITDAAAVRRIFEDFAPSVVVNCAAMTQVDVCELERERCWQVNVDAVEHLARSCRKVGAHFVQISTDFVFDGTAGPYKEADRPDPVNFYGKSKLASENVSREAGERRWAVARTILVYGAEANLSRSNIMLWVRGELKAARKIRVVTDQWRSPTYNVDLAAGVERIIRKRAHGVFHIGGPEMLSVHDFAVRIAHAFDLDSSLIQPTHGGEFSQTAARPMRTGLDLGRAMLELGYHPRSIDEALAEIRTKLESWKR